MQLYRKWSFYNPVMVTSGPGEISDLPSLLLKDGGYLDKSSSKTGLLVTSKSFTERGLTAKLQKLLNEQQKELQIEIIDDVKPNPDISAIEEYAARLQDKDLQFVIGLGGGSVMDTAKALSYLLSVNDPNFSLRAHFNGKLPLPEKPPLKMIAIPTTAGTGSEVTPFATIWDMAERKKYSLARPDLFPFAAILDGELTLTMSEETTVTTALDVLSHALESVWNINASPVTVNMAGRAIEIVLSTLPALLNDPNNIDYRSKMLTGSYLGGMCISSTRTALAHSMSYPITAALGAPHGLACAFTLPALLEFNAKGFEKSSSGDNRFEIIAGMSGCRSVKELTGKLTGLFAEVGVKDLMKKYGINAKNLQSLVSAMYTPERAGNNLRSVEQKEMEEIFCKACKL